eukprot:scaffold80_cov106-Isochrysis_galbana.AAC.9
MLAPPPASTVPAPLRARSVGSPLPKPVYPHLRLQLLRSLDSVPNHSPPPPRFLCGCTCIALPICAKGRDGRIIRRRVDSEILEPVRAEGHPQRDPAIQERQLHVAARHVHRRICRQVEGCRAQLRVCLLALTGPIHMLQRKFGHLRLEDARLGRLEHGTDLG